MRALHALDNAVPARRAGVFYALFYSGQFILLGVQLPFFAGWLSLNGFAVEEIGMLTASALVARLALGPLVAFWADHQSDERLALRLVAALFAVAALSLTLFSGKAVIAVAAFFVLWSFGLLVPLTDSAVLRADRNGWLHYGRTRAIGSFAFLSTTLLGGALLSAAGVGAAAPTMAGAAAFAFLAAFFLPAGAGGRGGARPMSWREAPRLLSTPVFLLGLGAAGLTQGAHAVYYAFSYLQWSALGYSAFTIGALWATGVIVEIAVLLGARRLIARRSPAVLLALGAGAAVLRWGLMTTAPPLPVLFLIQTMHALTFAATYLGSIEFIDRAVPPRLVNTGMTLMSATGVGALTGAATAAAGFLWGREGPAAAYALMAAMGGGALLCALGIVRLWDGGRLFHDLERPQG